MYLEKCCSIKWLIINTLMLLVILIGVNLLAFVGFPAIINSQIHKTVELDEGTIQWDRFKKLPVDWQIKVYFFNITNTDEVQNNGAFPHLKEVGPYYYRQTLERNISYIDSDSVSYKQIRNITFDEKKSAPLKSSDKLHILNPILVVATQITSPIERLVTYGCFDSLFPTNVRDFFIDADVDSLVLDGLIFARDVDVKGSSCRIVRNLLIERVKLMKNVDLTISNGSIVNARFSLLNYMQSKSDGSYKINRGINDISQLGNLIQWNKKNNFGYWGTPNSINNETCEKVRGTDGTMYPPHVTTDKEFEIFSSDICRVIPIGYNGTKKYKGMEGFIFGVDSNTLQTHFPNPEHDCYCTKTVSDQSGTPSCFLDGVMDVQLCFNAPLLISWPHFLFAEEYRNGVTGLDYPNPDKHKTFILIEPNTGTPLEGYKRIQFNFVIRPISFIPTTANHPRTVVPFTWIEEGIGLSQDLMNELDSKYYGKVRLVEGVKYALIALFAALLCISVVFLLRKKYCTKK